MALIIGNKSNVNATPAASTYTLSHDQDVGDDGYLLISSVMSNTVTHTTATYDGVPMTLILSYTSATLSQTWAIYGIELPNTGVNDIVFNFSGSQFNPASFYACSFTGSGGVGSIGNNDDDPTPHSRSLTVSENSIIYAFGISVNSFTDIEIDGSSRPAEFTHNTNRQVQASLSLPNLPEGSIDSIISVTFGQVSNTRIEILEATSGGSQGTMFLLF